jgi:hypothetical protein
VDPNAALRALQLHWWKSINGKEFGLSISDHHHTRPGPPTDVQPSESAASLVFAQYSFTLNESEKQRSLYSVKHAKYRL